MLPQAVARILAEPGVSQAHWGISVVSMSGSLIYSLNDKQLFNPASNAKLLTTSAAFALLPSGLTFTTQIRQQHAGEQHWRNPRGPYDFWGG